MRRRMQNLLGGKSDKKTSQAAAAEDADDVVDDPLDNNALGLEVWVKGVNPTVEYDSLIVFSVIHLLTRLIFVSWF
jgi:hypothetical protein